MASASGSLLNYFKQPKKGPDTAKLPVKVVEECIIIDDDKPTSSKRKGSLTSVSDASGKRRKLSLLNSRSKQNNGNPRLDKNKRSAVNGLKLLGKISASHDLCSPPSAEKKEKRENQARTPSKRNCNKDLDIKLVSKTLKRELKISTEIKEDSLSPIKQKRGFKKQACILSESEEDSPEIITETEEESLQIITEAEEESLQIITEPESVDESENIPSIQSTPGRRSTRTRKPVERYTVDISDESSNGLFESNFVIKLKILICFFMQINTISDAKRTPRKPKKKEKENSPPEDDLLIIDNVPKPRRSVSSVLGFVFL